MATFRENTAAEQARAELLRQREPKLRRLADLVRERVAPAEVWVFGSRARGDERPDSDWDLMLIVFDDANAEAAGDRNSLWQIHKEVGLVGDVVAVTVGDARASRNVANTLMYAARREGIRVA
jgi:predicted nucleotidyltransferase